ncbi:hypothetical protein FQA39_LY08394 [Lamprigera yunnana]|nr:hypothetical protein FQA39_LY08394 [Lamprigera yunnana]
MRKLQLLLFSLLNLKASCEVDFRIAGGKEANIEDFPYQISFNSGGMFCGGSLIEPDKVLTSAHCISSRRNHFYITAGTTYSRGHGTHRSVISICNHPKYNPYTYDYDVSVLTLSEPFILSKTIQTIELVKRNEFFPVGTYGNVTGWGATNSGSARKSDTLRAVEVPLVDHARCVRKYRRLTDITARMSCFGYNEGEKDSCHGDSGGALTIGNRLACIVSFGYECAEPNHPGVYTNISHPEIYDHIQQCLL